MWSATSATQKKKTQSINNNKIEKRMRNRTECIVVNENCKKNDLWIISIAGRQKREREIIADRTNNKSDIPQSLEREVCIESRPNEFQAN